MARRFYVQQCRRVHYFLLLTFGVLFSQTWTCLGSNAGSTAGVRKNGYEKRNLFDPKGHQLQLDFAEVAISRNSGTTCFIQVDDGVVFIGARKSPSSILSRQLPTKTILLDNHRVLVSACGVLYDGISILEKLEGLVQTFQDIFPSWDMHPSTLNHIATEYSRSLYKQHDLHVQQFVPEEDAEPLVRRIPGVHLVLAGINNQKEFIENEKNAKNIKRSVIFLIRPDGSRSHHRILVQGEQSEKVTDELLHIIGTEIDVHGKRQLKGITVNDLLSQLAQRRFFHNHIFSKATEEQSSEALHAHQINNDIEIFTMFTEHKNKNILCGTWYKIDSRSLVMSK